MEIAKLVLEFLKVLTWPLIFVALVLAFREEFRGLLQRMTTVRTPGGAELEFAERAHEVRSEAENLLPAELEAASAPDMTGEEPDPANLIFDALVRVAKWDGRSAVNAAWHEVGSRLVAMWAVNEARKGDQVARVSAHLAEYLHTRDGLTGDDASLSNTTVKALADQVGDLIGNLSQIHDDANKDGAVVPAEAAVDFVETSRMLCLALDKVTRAVAAR
ncbi:hypothetical protein [Streptomyces sp. NPDC059649]|uniref:hypothetical protein n=1 Tax=Streptomyces sp. NPDC059649 TaxID=3346895 RepID=UPI003690DAA3